MKKVRRKSKKTSDTRLFIEKEMRALGLIFLGIFISLSFTSDSMGILGEFFKFIFTILFSKISIILSYGFIGFGIIYGLDKHERNRENLIKALFILAFLILFYGISKEEYIPRSIFSLENIEKIKIEAIKGNGPGFIPSLIALIFIKIFGIVGSYICAFFMLAVFIFKNSKLTLNELLEMTGKKMKTSTQNIGSLKDRIKNFVMVEDEEEEDIPKQKVVFEKFNKHQGQIEILEEVQKNLDREKSVEESKKAIEKIIETPVKRERIGDYILPPFEILNSLPQKKKDNLSRVHQKNSMLLEETLSNFGISAKIINVTQGPSITRYEMQPSPGTKVSKIVGLSDDLALSLAARSIRIEAPIPGKSAIGIEVPNEIQEPVFFREMVESKVFRENSSKLTFALGLDIEGKEILADIGKMPHLLVAGSTGSGKSVCINTLISSILYNATPDEVKFIMVDPKMVELKIYDSIPHLLLPVVTDPKKAPGVLNWVVQEMTRRYNLFSEFGARDMEGYNQKTGEALPRIVVIIDELADLMMVSPSEVEDAICRIAQMARAAGIHLVIATQRPSVDVITGLIKANIPSRIAFAVSSQMDSRTILDMGGAEKLLGKGDMLYAPIGSNKPQRIQGAFISSEEVERVVEYMSPQGKDTKREELLGEIEEAIQKVEVATDMDPLMEDIKAMLAQVETISTSMIQRKFKIGYNRAARIMEDLESQGVVGAQEGSKPRRVLLK